MSLPTSEGEFIQYWSSSHFTRYISDWSAKRALWLQKEGSRNYTGKSLIDIMRDATVLCSIPAPIDPMNSAQLWDWASNRLYSSKGDSDNGQDFQLLERFIIEYYDTYVWGPANYVPYSDPANEAIIAGAHKLDSGANNASKTAQNTAEYRARGYDDARLNLDCGIRTILTFGIEPILNETSPCRTNVFEQKGVLETAGDGVKTAAGDLAGGSVKAADSFFSGMFDGIRENVGFGILLAVGSAVVVGLIISNIQAKAVTA